MANTKKRWTADEIEILRSTIPQKEIRSVKDYPEELQKAAGSRHQKWKYPKTFPLQQLYRMMLNMSDYGQRQRIKYSESIMLRRAVRYVIA